MSLPDDFEEQARLVGDAAEDLLRRFPEDGLQFLLYLAVLATEKAMAHAGIDPDDPIKVEGLHREMRLGARINSNTGELSRHDH